MARSSSTEQNGKEAQNEMTLVRKTVRYLHHGLILQIGLNLEKISVTI